MYTFFLTYSIVYILYCILNKKQLDFAFEKEYIERNQASSGIVIFILYFYYMVLIYILLVVILGAYALSYVINITRKK